MRKTKILLIVLSVAIAFGAMAPLAGAFTGTGVEVLARDVSVVRSGIVGRKLVLSDKDIKCAFAIDDFESITVTALPSSKDGTLLLAGRRVREGQTVKRRNIAAMVFVPKDATVTETCFRFSLNGEGDYLFTLKFLERTNYAPKLEGGSTETSLSTQRDISVFGRMEATDPEGDRLTYVVCAYPRSGRLTEIGDGGEFMYTPNEGFTGYDRFVYAVRDEYGNWSEPKDVILRVNERMSEVVYRDMTDRAEYNAAVAMSAMGVMSGRLIGDDYYFIPEEGVTRAEFVAMALKAAGISAEVGESYFDDNEDIPAPLRGYIARAGSLGIVDGEYKDGRLLFSPARNITVIEAAGIMSRILGCSGGESGEYSELTGVPSFAVGYLEAMSTLGIIDIESCNLEGEVNRADAAEFLYRMVKNS